jgi:hypothetical protein
MLSTRQSLFWMSVYLLVIGVICALLYVPLRSAFMANWGFNAGILAVFLVGVVINFRQVVTLNREIEWIRVFRTGQTGLSVTEEPRLLKPLAKHLSTRRRDRFRLSALALRTVLDGIRERLDEAREISRYLVATLVFLGLLGTFWGLLGTIGAVGQVINGLTVGDADFAAVFDQLKQGLQRPLEGMGTAFSSSLFGLGGSLALGFLDLQAGHAQNRFFNGLEEWLSGVTQLVDDAEQPPLDRMASGGAAAASDPDLAAVLEPEPANLADLVAEIRAERQLLERLLQQQAGATAHDPAPRG